MTAVHIQVGTILLLLSMAAAQSAIPQSARLYDVKVMRDGRDVLIDLTLSDVVKTSVSTAARPDRIVIELPRTTSSAKQQRIAVNFQGVRNVRYGLHSTDPAVTRVVIELDSPETYSLKANGTHLVLTIEADSARNTGRQGAPAAAASGGFIGVFRRQQSLPPVAPPVEVADTSTPPPTGPRIAFPSPSDAPANQTAASKPAPSAAHPDKGSLQEGTVFPNMGAPGAGTVPGASDTTVGGFDSGTKAEAGATNASASTSVPAGFSTVAEQKSSPPVAGQTSTPTLALSPTPALASEPAKLVVPGNLDRESPAREARAAPDVTPRSASEVEQGANSQPPAAENTAVVAAVSDLDQQLLALRAANPNLRTVFKVKYVADGVAYLDGGRADGLTEGMKLQIKDSDHAPRAGEIADPADPSIVADLQVNAVADTSSVTDISNPKRPVKPGDLAYLSSADALSLVQQQALSATRKYPTVISFTEGDTLDEEAREEVPKPPLPSVNRARGRIGLDYTGTSSSGITTSDLGLVVRTDITRLNGTYWNVSGYWRGRLQSSAPAGQQTIQDLINRTYHLSMTYDNPNSAWVAGFGRLYLPWAPSLETIDGGYFGRRLAKGTTVGIFGGSTPDPTSYSYNPDQEIGGLFINFDGGSYQDWKYTSTSGLGISALNFAINRPFVFFENGVFYKRYFSIYDSMQADSPKGNSQTPAPGPGLSRNFLTIRVQPHPRVEFDVNENYFRDIPTFDPALIGTTLLDKYLFQGFSAGARVEVAKQIYVYTQLGASNRTGDAKTSLNDSFGVTFNHVPWIAARADAHYSRFNSSFGSGSYEAFTLSRNINEGLRLELLLGQQNFNSTLPTSDRSRFANVNFESTLGAHYFLQGGFGFNRGDLNYQQWHFSLGYRFDSKGSKQ